MADGEGLGDYKVASVNDTRADENGTALAVGRGKNGTSGQPFSISFSQLPPFWTMFIGAVTALLFITATLVGLPLPPYPGLSS